MATTRTRPSHRSKESHDNLLAALSGVVQVSPRSSRAASQPQPLQSSSSASYSGAQPMTYHDPVHSLPATSLLPGQDPLASGAAPPAVPAKTAGMATKFANAFRRQTNEDKAAKKAAAKGGAGLGRSKTVSTRMDVIDKLDVSGIHGDSLFHHDSPYDACSPHANRSTQRAPVGAFDPNIDPMTGRPFGYTRNGGGAAASTSSQMPPPPAPKGGDGEDDLYHSSQDSKMAYNAPSSAAGGRPRGQRSATSPMVPSLPLTGNQASTSAVNLHRGGGGGGADSQSVTTESSDMDSNNDRYSRSTRNKAPNAIADMWGHVDEPWQDFAQPKQDKSRGRHKNNNRQDSMGSGAGGAGGSGSGNAGGGMLSPYGRDGSRDGPPSAASSVFDMEAVMTGKTAEEKRRPEDIGGVSPFPEPDYGGGEYAGGGGAGGGSSGPKRSKSLIKRIKSARQYGNVPPPDDDVVEMSNGGRARSKRYGPHKHSPSTPTTDASSPGAAEWSTLNATGSLGRSSTRRATQEEQKRYHSSRLAPGASASASASNSRNGSGSASASGTSSPATTGMAPAAYFDGVTGGGGGSGAAEGSDEYRGSPRGRGEGAGGGGGVGRSGSIFGRFGRKNKAAAA